MEADAERTPHSAVGRLLQEVSWQGRQVSGYHDGGLGQENVLTTEVMIALDFLPRRHFLGAVLSAATGADAARRRLVGEIEDATLVVLPDEIKLRPSGPTYQEQLVVQPDGLVTSMNCYALVEAKRILRSAFQPYQLAREYVSVLQEAGPRMPLLLLLLAAPPPVPVKGHGRLSIEDAVALALDDVLAAADAHVLEADELRSQLQDVVAWTTWTTVRDVVDRRKAAFGCTDASVVRAVARLADSVGHAVLRHS